MQKFAKVVPVPKAKSTEDVTNYRLISLLSISIKVFEKLMHTRLTSFLKKHNSIFVHQFGFRNNTSTSLAILDLYSELINAIKKIKKL